METKLAFTVQSILSRTKDGDVIGPMSSLSFAQLVCKRNNHQFDRLARISFAEMDMLQEWKNDKYTNFNVLIIAAVYPNDLRVSLWVNKGITGIPVAMTFKTWKDIQIAPVYHTANFAKKLSEAQISEIFSFLSEHPEVMDILEGK